MQAESVNCSRYKQLLRDYHKVIDQPDWPEARMPLVEKMDWLWNKMRPHEHEAVLAYAEELYQRRIN